MASFAPNLPDQSTAVPNFAGMSQAPSMREAYATNRGLETLFSGIGQGISGVTKTTNQAIDQGIEKDVYGAVDPVRNQQGLNDVFGGQPDTSGSPTGAPGQAGASTGNPLAKNTPPNSADFQSSIGRLTQAFQQGKIGDTYYYAQLEAATRQLRAKYPGYRDDVDQMIQSTTGITPANALRRSILQDLQKGQSLNQAQANRDQSYLSENEKFLPPDFYKRQASGNPYSMTETHAYVTEQKQDQQQIETTKAKIALSLEQNNLNVTDAQTGASQGLNLLYNKMSNDATMAGGGINGIVNQINTARASGENLSPEKAQAMTSAFGLMKSQFTQKVDGFLNQPFGKNGESYASILGPDKAKQVHDAAIARIDSVGTMLTDQNFGALAMNSNFTKAMSDSDGRAFMEGNPVFRNLAAVSKIPGAKEYLPLIMSDPRNKALPQVLSAVSDALSNTRRLSGSNPSQDVQSIHQMEQKKGPGGVKKYINDAVNDLTNPAAPAEFTANTARSMFSPQNQQFLQYFKPEERMDLFTQLTRPDITKKIAATGDPQLFRQYSDWSKNAFIDVFREAGSEIHDSVNREWYDVKYDPKANQFSVVPTQAGVQAAGKDSRSSGMNPLNWMEQYYNGNLQTQVDKINRGLKTMEPILKQGGYDPGKELGGLLNNAGFTAGQKVPTFFEKARHSLDRVFGGQAADKFSEASNFGGVLPNFTQPSVGDAEGVISLDDLHEGMSGTQGRLLDTIAKGEGTSGPDGYDVAYGGRKADLTSKTLGQVLEFQDHMKALGLPSTAVGRYQVISKTLKSTIQEMGFNPDQKFTPELQDKIAEHLLEKRGYSAYKAGKISPEDFQDQLAQEWASVPTRSGKSFYEGDGLNHAHLSPQALREVLANR